jgi:hypothetical protein
MCFCVICCERNKENLWVQYSKPDVMKDLSVGGRFTTTNSTNCSSWSPVNLISAIILLNNTRAAWARRETLLVRSPVLCLCRLSLSRARNFTSYDCTESRQEATSLGLAILSPASVACLCRVQPNCTFRLVCTDLTVLSSLVNLSSDFSLSVYYHAACYFVKFLIMFVSKFLGHFFSIVGHPLYLFGNLFDQTYISYQKILYRCFLAN